MGTANTTQPPINFKKEHIPNIQLNSGIFNILLKIYNPPMGLPGRASVSVIPTYVGNVVQNIYYNPIQI